MRFKPEWMQLETGISISRYFPAIGTAGLLRDLVSGNRRVPRPPPRISETTRGMKPLLTLVGEGHRSGQRWPRANCRPLLASFLMVHDPEGDREMMAIRRRKRAMRAR